MLSTLRSATQSIFAKILLLLLVASFAVWGVSGVFVAGAGNATVEFGKTSVSLLDHRLAYDLQVNNLSRQLGQRITREQARSFGIEQSVLGQVIAGAVLDENARQMGMSVSNDELASMIGDDPAFRDSTGRFSRLTLENVLRQVGMREDDYLRNRKAVAVRRQFADAIADNVAPPIAFFDAFGAYQAQKRVFEYVTVDTSAVTDKPVPSDSDVETWYEDHKNDYLAPEYRKIALVRLTAEDISQPDLIDEAAVKENYEADKARFTTPFAIARIVAELDLTPLEQCLAQFAQHVRLRQIARPVDEVHDRPLGVRLGAQAIWQHRFDLAAGVMCRLGITGIEVLRHVIRAEQQDDRLVDAEIDRRQEEPRHQAIALPRL